LHYQYGTSVCGGNTLGFWISDGPEASNRCRIVIEGPFLQVVLHHADCVHVRQFWCFTVKSGFDLAKIQSFRLKMRFTRPAKDAAKIL